MSFEIHMYSAVAAAGAASGYPEGERHPLLIFVRQRTDSEHDMGRAASAARDAGWTAVDITRAGTLPPDAGASMEAPVRHAYGLACEDGASVMAFDAVATPAPRKA